MIRKAAFFDLDGTLAVDNQPPSQEVFTAVRAFQAKGNRIFLCTGRATAHLYSAVLDIGFDGIVAAGGAFVSVGGRLLCRRLLTADQIRRTISFFLRDGHPCILEGEQNLYTVNGFGEWAKAYPAVTDPDAFEPGRGEFAGQGVFKFTAYGPVADPIRRLLGDEVGVIDHGRFAEVVPAGCSKADGIRRVLAAAGIARENSIAIGDSRNDVDMLQYAGLGIAMGGAPEPVRRAADRVTSTFAENGVAAALRSLM